MADIHYAIAFLLHFLVIVSSVVKFWIHGTDLLNTFGTEVMFCLQLVLSLFVNTITPNTIDRCL